MIDLDRGGGSEANQSRWVVGREDLNDLVSALKERGFEVIGPTIRDGAVVYDHIETLGDLPVGYSDEQQPGAYRLQRRKDQALFQYTVAAQSWKRFLHPPATKLLKIRKSESGFEFTPSPPPSTRYAFLGVRGCDLRAIDVLGRALDTDRFQDPGYAERRKGIFVIAVHCGHATEMCFCTSMGTGPRAGPGFDLALTEILEGEHRFLVEIGTPAGAQVAEGLKRRTAEQEDLEAAERVVENTASQIRKTMDTGGIKELLYGNLEHPRWQDVAQRCLACTNCTMVCPTCFCNTVEDTSDLTGETAERWRYWDSCFSDNFSYIHGGSVRTTIKSRYRQWMTHKLATWHDQFGVSGCVGCGRCITWCPVGIDITEEVRAIRENPL